jgi:hypothetical protein
MLLSVGSLAAIQGIRKNVVNMETRLWYTKERGKYGNKVVVYQCYRIIPIQSYCNRAVNNLTKLIILERSNIANV